MAGRSAGRRTARTGRRTPGHPAAHPPAPARPAAAAPPPAATTPTTTADHLRYGTRPRSLLAQGVEAILSTAPAVITHRHAGFSGGSNFVLGSRPTTVTAWGSRYVHPQHEDVAYL